MSANSETPKCPPQSYLPNPVILWSGQTTRLLTSIPCRIVLSYVWSLDGQKTKWVADPHYVYEVADTTDSMGEFKYSVKPFAELPATFFEDLLKLNSK